MDRPLQLSLVTSTLSPSGEPAGREVFGLDNVRLDLPLAGVASRTLAASIDHLFLSFLHVIWFVLGTIFMTLTGTGLGWVMAILLFGFFLLQWGYFAALEIAMEGQTPGKYLVGLRTVAFHGGRATAMALLIRNLLRTLDFFVGVGLMLFDARHRRLGDFVAGTVVLYEQGDEEEARMVRHPSTWGAKEVSVVESFLKRRAYLEPEQAQKLALRLLTWLEEREPAFVAEVGPTVVETGDAVERLQQIFESRG